MKKITCILICISLILFLLGCKEKEERLDLSYYDLIHVMWEDYAFQAFQKGEYQPENIEEIIFLGRTDYIENLAYKTYAEFIYMMDGTRTAYLEMIVIFQKESNLKPHIYQFTLHDTTRRNPFGHKYYGGKIKTLDQDADLDGYIKDFNDENQETISKRRDQIQPLHKDDSIHQLEYIEESYTYENLLEHITHIESFHEVDHIYYSLYEDQHAEVVGYNKEVTQLSFYIQDEVEGHQVTKINDKAFYEAIIGTISFSSYLNEIGAYAFKNARIINLEIPATIRIIKEEAFRGAQIRTFSMEEDSQLIEIGNLAFEDAQLSDRFLIPKGIKHIGNYVFHKTRHLTSIDVEDGNLFYQSTDGILYNKDKTILIAYPTYKLEESYTVPKSVIQILPVAFKSNLYLEHIEFESNSQLRMIGFSAFAYTKISSITIPRNVNFIGDQAFYAMGYLSSIHVDILNRNYVSLNGVLFSRDKTELITYPIGNTESSYVIPSSVKEIKAYSFYGAVYLESITFAEEANIKKIGMYAFGYTSITSMIIPMTVEIVDLHIFYDVNSLENVYVESAGKPENWSDDWIFYNDIVTWGYR